MTLQGIDPRYPVGKFSAPATISPDDRTNAIATLAELPEQLRNAVEGLNGAQLNTHYRDGGWTVRQLVHHIADSHMNAFIRIRLALTEDWPVIKPYDEHRWAELADARQAPIEASLALLEALHARLVILLYSLGPGEWSRVFLHPERGVMTLDDLLALYAWHGRHHVAHITALRAREGW